MTQPHGTSPPNREVERFQTPPLSWERGPGPRVILVSPNFVSPHAVLVNYWVYVSLMYSRTCRIWTRSAFDNWEVANPGFQTVVPSR